MGRGVRSSAGARSIVISSGSIREEASADTDSEGSPPSSPSSPSSPAVLRTLSEAHSSAARLKMPQHNNFLFSCVMPRVHKASDDVIIPKPVQERRAAKQPTGKGNAMGKRPSGISKALTAPAGSLESPRDKGNRVGECNRVGESKSLDKDSDLDRSFASNSSGSSSSGRAASRRLSSFSMSQATSLSALASTESSLPGSPVLLSNDNGRSSADNGCSSADNGCTTMVGQLQEERAAEETGDMSKVAEALEYVLSREDAKTPWEATASFFHHPSTLPLPKRPTFLLPFLSPQELDHVNVRKGKPNFSHFYRLGATLGVGGYGTVRDCVHARTGEAFACKVVRKDIFPEQKHLLRARLESQLQDMVSPHPHIVQAKQLFEDDKFLYLVMEKCSGGDLFTFMEQHAPLSESTAACLISQMVSALRACHDHEVLHRDLKLENVLLTKPEADGPKVQLKLGDFGSAVLIPHGKRAVGWVGGSTMYQAPEVLSGKKYDYKADIWSLGVILYTMLVGSFPFSAPTEGLLGGMIKRGVLRTAVPKWYGLSPEARNAVMCMLQVDPSQRASIGDISFHPWLLKHSAKGQHRARTLSS